MTDTLKIVPMPTVGAPAGEKWPLAALAVGDSVGIDCATGVGAPFRRAVTSDVAQRVRVHANRLRNKTGAQYEVQTAPGLVVIKRTA